MRTVAATTESERGGEQLQAVKAVEGGPGDGAVLESDADGIAIVGEALAIDDLGGGYFRIERGDAHQVTRLPSVSGKDARAVRADVVGEGALFAIVSGALSACQTHHDDDRQAPFHSATGTVVQRGLAQSLTG